MSSLEFDPTEKPKEMSAEGLEASDIDQMLTEDGLSLSDEEVKRLESDLQKLLQES